MTAERPGAALLGGPKGLGVQGLGGVCRVQMFAASFRLLLCAAVIGARVENDFSLVSPPARAL